VTPKNDGELDIRITATDRVAVTGSTEGSLSASDVFRMTVSRDKKEKDDRGDAVRPGDRNEWDDKPFKTPGHADAGNRHELDKAHGKEQESAVRTPGKEQDSVRETSPAKPVGLDAEQLDKYLQEFDRTTGTSGGIDYSARWQAVSRALAKDLASFDDDTRLHNKQAADISHFGNTAGDGMGSNQAHGVDSFTLAGGSGTNLKNFKGLQEGMAKLG
jgi:hypothetical protein